MNAEQFIANEARKQKNNDFTLTAGEIHSKPLTFKQLSERLKHIAGLCWGLSIDLQNEIKYRHALEADREQLNNRIKELNEENKLLRMRLAGRARNKQRAIEEANAPSATALTQTKVAKRTKERKRKPDEELTPEELRKRNKHREWNARYYAKKRAEQSADANGDGKMSTTT